jgi:protein-disulfide isomerase
MKRLALALGLAFAALPAAAFDINEMSDAERQTFRAEIRSYLLENPQVLMEAIAVLEQQQQADQSANDVALLAANEVDLYADEASWVGGNPEGDVTIVEFLDYRCGFCRRAHPEVSNLIAADGNIRLIIKEFPILGEQSTLASRFAIAVLQLEGRDMYKKAHDELILFRGEISEQSLSGLANRLGLDADKVGEQMNSPDVDTVIAQNRALGQRLQINGTPSFVFGDQMVRGYVPLNDMQSIVRELRADG